MSAIGPREWAAQKRSSARKNKDDAASRLDEDNPEWTREEIRTAELALDEIVKIFGMQAGEASR